VLRGTLFGGVAHSGYGDQIANSRYEPTLFSLELGRKDLRLAMQAASDAGLSLPTAQILDELLGEALGDPELGSKDWAALAEVTRSAPRPNKG
ncbi:MAG: NAD(P)-dependent oxidoreductase, partial [Aquiluna sp.]